MQSEIKKGTEISPEEFRAILNLGLQKELSKTDEFLANPEALNQNFNK